MNNLFANFDLTTSADTTKSKVEQKIVKKSIQSSVTNQNLFGEEFNIELNKPKPEALLSKIDQVKTGEVESTKILKSKKVTLAEKLEIIKTKVLEVLGKQRKNVVVIKTQEEFEDYITNAINFGRIAIDTETNNSTDPTTCQLMGPCFYYEGGKQAYVPINHVNPDTGERLDWQLTEEDVKNQLQRIKDANTFVVMHNGKFDYEVLKCTCDIEIEPNWDTMIGAHVLNENELIGLKKQYIMKIDPTQEKYDIEDLFIIPYKYVDPEIFALYAATDSMMTDKLYSYQVAIFEQPENEKLYWMFRTIEIPIIKVTADIELIGVRIDQDFGERLRLKYNKLLDNLDAKIDTELEALKPTINNWKIDPKSGATLKTKQYQPKKSKLSPEKLEIRYPEVDEKTGLRYKVGKAKIEQLGDPINLASPTQLAILFYDILKCKSVSKKSPRGTGKDEMEALAEKYPNLTLCKLIVERRGIVKLISTYIDIIPALAKHWPDGRVRYRLNSAGTDTGRFSSGGDFKFLDENENRVEMASINSQNIPSRGDGKVTRMLFQAKQETGSVELSDNFYKLPEISEIETTNGYKFGKDLVIGDKLITDEGEDTITNIVYSNKEYFIYI